MPGGFPLGTDICNGTDLGAVTATSLGTTITANASANTKGTYTQLTASLALDACWMIIGINNPAATGLSVAFDIAVGAAGVEKDVFPNLIAANNGNSLYYYSFPCSIPAGSRVAVRMQASTGGDAWLLSMVLFDGAFTQMEGYAAADAVGFTAGTTRGSTVDPGATANTKGTYTQLTASTTRDYAGFCVGYDLLGNGTVNSGLLDIATGVAGVEQIIVPNLPYCKAPSPPPMSFIAVAIPAGTRVAARAQCTINTATARNVGVTLYGFYQ